MGESSSVPGQSALVKAIDACIEAYGERFGRAPSARELVRVFEVALATLADNLVLDAAAVAKAWPVELALVPYPPASELTVTVAPVDPTWGDYELFTVEIPTTGNIRCLVFEGNHSLWLDYWRPSHPHAPGPDETRALLLATVLPKYRELYPDRRPPRAVLRVFDALEDPFLVDLT